MDRKLVSIPFFSIFLIFFLHWERKDLFYLVQERCNPWTKITKLNSISKIQLIKASMIS